MTLNIELLREAVEWAKKESVKPKEDRTWDQGRWMWSDVKTLMTARRIEGDYGTWRAVSCGTSMCIAGHISLLAGDKFVYPEDDLTAYEPDDSIHVEHALTSDGEINSIRNRAMELLGITNGEADYLFESANDPQDLEEIAAEIAEDHGLVW